MLNSQKASQTRRGAKKGFYGMTSRERRRKEARAAKKLRSQS